MLPRVWANIPWFQSRPSWLLLVFQLLPPVIEAGEFLKAPEAQLRALCERLGTAFTPRMLSWPPGARASDGVWAPHWYQAVLRSTGFEPYRERDRRVPAEFRAIIDAVMPGYERLFAQRLLA